MRINSLPGLFAACRGAFSSQNGRASRASSLAIMFEAIMFEAIIFEAIMFEAIMFEAIMFEAIMFEAIIFEIMFDIVR